MKTRKAIRAITIGFAVTMFTSFVLYSQFTQSRQPDAQQKAASSKKSVQSTSFPTPTQTDVKMSDIIASSSKSMAPLIKVPANVFEKKSAPGNPALESKLSSAKPTFGSSITNVVPPTTP